MPGDIRQFEGPAGALLEGGQSILDAAEVDEIAGQDMAVRGGMQFKDADSLLGASGAGEKLSDVLRRVRCPRPGCRRPPGSAALPGGHPPGSGHGGHPPCG